MSNSSLRDNVVSNFTKHRGQYQPKESNIRNFQKITPEMMYDLLENCSFRCRAAARDLIREMSVLAWTIKSAPKEGGFDRDAPLHITIDAPVNNSKPAYHLNCKETKNGLVIIGITQCPLGLRR